MNLNSELKAQWEARYTPMWEAFQTLFTFHMTTSKTPEEAQLRIVGDMSITVVNMFLVNAAVDGMSEKQLRQECIDFIDNMRIAILKDDLAKYATKPDLGIYIP